MPRACRKATEIMAAQGYIPLVQWARNKGLVPVYQVYQSWQRYGLLKTKKVMGQHYILADTPTPDATGRYSKSNPHVSP